MAYLGLIKYVVIALVIGGIIWAIHQNGRAVERGECVARENTQLLEARERLEEANKRNAALASRNLQLNDEITKHAAENLGKVVMADAALRRDPVGLQISAQVCRDTVSVPGTSAGTGIDHRDGRSDGIRLPARVETDLYDFAFKANRTRIKRDECQAFAIGLAKMREAWEKEQEADR